MHNAESGDFHIKNPIRYSYMHTSGQYTLLKQGCIYTPQKVYSVRFKNYPP